MDGKSEIRAEKEDNKIILSLLNGTGYIFDVQDYMKMRREHRIMGSMVGTCATRGWSPNDCTMPVELTTWETRLLLEENFAVLVSKKQNLLSKETEEQLKNYERQFEKRIMEQEEVLRDEKIKEAERNLDKVIKGKRKKLLKQGVPEKEIKIDPSEILNEIRQGITFDKKNALLDIPCAHPEPHSAFKVNFTSQSDASLKYLVFRDFWSRGKYVTCGDAFGADFLIYPGDPLQFHASHIVILLEDAKINGLELVSKVRLSVTVNKLCVLAFFDESSSSDDLTPQTSKNKKNRKICYQTITWMGDKDKERRYQNVSNQSKKI